MLGGCQSTCTSLYVYHLVYSILQTSFAFEGCNLIPNLNLKLTKLTHSGPETLCVLSLAAGYLIPVVEFLSQFLQFDISKSHVPVNALIPFYSPPFISGTPRSRQTCHNLEIWNEKHSYFPAPAKQNKNGC